MGSPVAGTLGSGGLSGTGIGSIKYETVTASTYTGATCRGLNFAELSNNPGAGAGGCDFSALQNLPRGTTIEVIHGGLHATLTKSDVGCGGRGLNGRKRALDLCPLAARALGVNGLANVKYRIIKLGSGDRPGHYKGKITAAGAASVDGSTPLDNIGNAAGALVNGAANAVSDSAKAAIAAANLATKMLNLFYAGAWWRIGKILFGAALLAYGINGLIKSFSGKSAVAHGKKIAETTATAVALAPK